MASIQRITNLTPIEGADQIVCAQILGWRCVVPKGEYSIGDLVVYFEVDSLLPIKPEYEFLRRNSYHRFEDGREGFRIKTRRFKKQISQGLVLRTNQVGGVLDGLSLSEGQDVTDLLGVTKYEPPMPSCLRGKALGRFPAFIPKTDETRVQLLQGVLDRHVGLECYVTEKIDGASATYYFDGEHFGLCSRNLEIDPTAKTWTCRNCQWKDSTEFGQCPRCQGTNILASETAYVTVAKQYGVELKLRTLFAKTGLKVAIQGEIYGVGIGGNNLQINGYKFGVFQVFMITECKYLDYDNLVDIIGLLNTVPDSGQDLELVPVVSDSFKLVNNIDELVKYATRRSLINPQRWAEGIVIRPLKEMLDLGMSMTTGMPSSSRLSFKVVNPEYLLVSENLK